MLESIHEIKDEMLEIKTRLYDFISFQQSKINPTFFKYSVSGDLWDDTVAWNVHSRVFAARVAYVIGVDKSNSLVQEALIGIKKFQHKNGYIYDDMLLSRKKWIRLQWIIRNLKWIPLIDYDYIRAESRQCHSALLMYKELPDIIPTAEVKNDVEIDKFLSSLNWKDPWAAGSHFSHLMFFQKIAHESGKLCDDVYEDNVARAYNWIKYLENEQTGSWHDGNVSNQQVINGAMKVITGLRTVDGTELLEESQCRKLINFCLNSINDTQACDNFNIVYVIYYASKKCPNYRKDEIMQFARNRFNIYMEYYDTTYGGFSFLKQSNNEVYYGCKIARGNKEPDIHGTMLFSWGLFYLSDLLGINDEVGLREIIS